MNLKIKSTKYHSGPCGQKVLQQKQFGQPVAGGYVWGRLYCVNPGRE